MLNRSVTALVCGVLMAFASTAFAQANKPDKRPADADKSKAPAKKSAPDVEPTLKVGHAAPALTFDAHLKGDKVTGFEKGKVYVVEFWATWCGPCIKNIPHLTELQKRHKGKLTVIGVAASERVGKDQPDKREENLKRFVREQGKKMDYTVVYDSTGAMNAAWRTPAGMNFIPSVFIVDGEGKLAYIGHPKDMETTINELVGAPADKKDAKKKEPKKAPAKTDPGTAPVKEDPAPKQPG